MATQLTYGTVGVRESLKDEISLITPIDAPFYNGIGSAKKPKNTKHEFETDTLRAPASNKVKEGSTPTIGSTSQPVKIYNMCQIQEESFSLSSTVEEVDIAGQPDPYDYHKGKKNKELVGDIEYAFTQEVRADGDANTARSMRGHLNWITSNLNKATDAVLNADGTVTAGTPRPLTADLVKATLQDIYTAGGGGKTKTLTAFCNVYQKGVFDTFYDIRNNRQMVEANKVNDMVDIYKTSFGIVKAETHRQYPVDVFSLLDMDFWKKATLKEVGIEPLAKKSSLFQEHHITVEHTLESKNEAANGRITDLEVL